MNADIERIKRDISIIDLVGQIYTVVGHGPTRTTAEHDSLKLFTRNNSWTWYSRSGRNGHALGGSVIDWWMLTHNCDHAQAIDALWTLLTGAAGAPSYGKLEQSTPPEPPKTPRWTAADWQTDAQRRLADAQDRLLNRPGGQPGRDYLLQRAIQPAAWAAWGLGYGPAYHPAAGRTLPALWLPWRNRLLTAVQWRFLTDDHDLRFAQLAGGQRYLFGLQHLAEAAPGRLNALFLVEGELNAISLWQTIEAGMYPADAISYGPQSNIVNHQVQRLAAAVAKRYQRVIVWADEPEIALQALGALPPTLTVLAVRSPGGRDANDLLVAGQLDDILFGLLKRVAERESHLTGRSPSENLTGPSVKASQETER